MNNSKTIPDDVNPEIEKARKFLEKAAKEYAPFTHAGLNQLPYILYDNVAKVMHEYATAMYNRDREEIERLKEETDRFAVAFAAWAKHDPYAIELQEAGATASVLLDKYKNRPYINPNTNNQ